MASVFSGANRELGRAMKAGVEAAFLDVNAAGGIHGRMLRLVTVDDGYDPTRTLPAMRQLVEREGVFAIVGNVGTPTAAVAAPYCMERRVLFFGPLSGGDLLHKSPPDRYVFTVRPSYAEETAAAVRWLTRVRRIAPSRIALFTQDDEFGASAARGAMEELRARGADPAGILRLGYRRNTDDVTGAVETLRAHARQVDAVVMAATYLPAAAFVRKIRDAGLRQIATDVSAVDSNALAEELSAEGRRYAEGVLVTQVVPLPTARLPSTLRFEESMARRGGADRPGFLALEGWVVGNVLAEGLRRAGRDLTTEGLVDALETIHGLDLGIGARISFDRGDHQGQRQVWGTMLQADGTWKQVSLE
jgi:ABC-type branched-subunit amino acid transport system substrate-binding protein